MDFSLKSIRTTARKVRSQRYRRVSTKQSHIIFNRAWEKVQSDIEAEAKKGNFNYEIDLHQYLGVMAGDSIQAPGSKCVTILLFSLSDFLTKKLHETGFKKVSIANYCCKDTCKKDAYRIQVSWFEDKDLAPSDWKSRKKV